MSRERKVPRRRFREFQNDEGWKYNKFKDVFDLLKNNTVSRDELNYEKGSVKNVHYGDVLIKYGDYIDVSKTKLPYFNCDKIVKKFASSLLQDGDIVIADTAEDETVGKCTEIQGASGVKLVSGLHTIPCRPKVKFAPKYLGYYINSYSYHDQLIPLMQGTKVTSISKSAIKETDMLIPKLIDEQRKIGEYLSNIDNIITLNQHKLEKLKALKKAYLTQMFPSGGECKPKLRFAGFDDEWGQRKLGDEIIEIVAGGDVDKSKIRNYGKYPVLANSLVNDGVVGYYNDDFRVKAPAVTVTGRGDVGHAKARKVNFTPVVRLISMKSKHDVDFLEHAINNCNVINESTGVPQLTVPQLSDYNIYFPKTIDEEDAIGEFLCKLEDIIKSHQRKLQKLQNLKKAYLNEMFI